MTARAEEEKLARIKLNAFPYLRTDWILRLITLYGSAGAVLERTAADLVNDGGISFTIAEQFLRAIKDMDPVRELEMASGAGVKVLTAEDAGFPDLLRQIYDPPLVLYVKGELAAAIPAVGIVGTRKPTDYGIRSAARIARELSSSGLVVASGMARGIDTVAHDAVVKMKGLTWAVLGTGLNVCYPRENKKLSERIVECGGALISEFTMNTGPMPANFPKRNRIISGLSYATLVIEGDFKSGSLITARTALEQGREVLALPGQVDKTMSRGPNMLIKNGAALAESGEDVMAVLPPEVLFGLKPAACRGGKAAAEGLLNELSPDAGQVYAVVRDAEDGTSIDEISHRFGWQVPRIAAALFELEAAALITPLADKYRAAV